LASLLLPGLSFIFTVNKKNCDFQFIFHSLLSASNFLVSYDNAKACAVVEAPSSSGVGGLGGQNNLNSMDLDDDSTSDNLVSDSSPKGGQYNNHYGEKGESILYGKFVFENYFLLVNAHLINYFHLIGLAIVKYSTLF